MNALAAAHDTAVQMIDTSIVRVHSMPRVLLTARANRLADRGADIRDSASPAQ